MPASNCNLSIKTPIINKQKMVPSKKKKNVKESNGIILEHSYAKRKTEEDLPNVHSEETIHLQEAAVSQEDLANVTLDVSIEF